jgi:hypothetical protein
MEGPPLLDGTDEVAAGGGGLDDGGEMPRNDVMSSGIVSGLFAVKGEEEENECAGAEKPNEDFKVVFRALPEQIVDRVAKQGEKIYQEHGCVAAERDECCFLYVHIME